MSVGGFYSPVIVDLAGLKASSQEIPALFAHDPGRIVGQTNAVKIGADGVSLEGIVTGDNADATEVVSQSRNGFKWQASIGASIDRREFLDSGKTATVNGREVTGPMLIAREATLFEISFVAIGADSQTTAAVAAQSGTSGTLKGAYTMFEKWIEARGFDPAALDETQRKSLQAMYDAEQAATRPATPTPTSTASLDEIVANRRKEDHRIAEITRLTAEAINDRPVMVDEFDKLAKAAIEAKSPVQEFELQLLRLGRSAPVNRTSSRIDSRVGRKMIEAAICVGGRLQNLEKHFDQQTLNAADEQFPGGIGLCDLLMMAARENGYTGHTTKDVRTLLRAAFSGGSTAIRAEFSTLSLPGILGNTANKFLLQGFNAVEAGWRELAAIRNVRDFKTNTSYSLTGGMVYDKVGPAGELKHGTVGELSYTNKADTYGKMFAITRTDIINDDLGALTAVPMKLGRGAALKLNDVFWTEFLSNANTFYTTGRGNVSTGAGSALSSAGLTAALLKFRKLVDADSLPTGIMPKILVVPVELEITADELMTSLIVNTGGSSTTDKVPNRNVWTNKFRTVSSTYLSNASYTGYSAAAWYMVADPADLPLIEVAFLGGRETPVVESADADFDTLGIQMRGYHDFGVAKQEFRASVRSAGS